MAVVATAALIVFVDGFLSLILARDIVELPDAGPLAGPAMALVVCLLVLLFVLRRRPLGLAARAISAGLSSAVLGPLVGALIYGAVRTEPASVWVFLGSSILSPFTLAASLIAAVVVAAAALAERAQAGGR
ncbi:MAG: hypothetical protein RI885_475 [Actinomycetota bacterium]